MTRRFATRRLRWAAPAIVAAAIAAGALTSTVSSTAAEPHLPTKTPAQLLASLEQARPDGFAGTIVETVKLGLPQLPNIGGASGDDADLSLTNLLTGAHTARVWYAGPDKQRVALLGQLSESDIIHNGADLWSYSSSTRKVTHTTTPANASKDFAGQHTLGGLTPQAAADKALAAIDPTTAVSVDSTARVAGRAAYQLVLTPRDTRSLIGSVRIAIDSETSVPLRVQVFAHGASSPAIQVGFTDVSFKVPDSSVFEFVPPAGSTVIEGSPLDQGMGPGPGIIERHSPLARGQATYGATSPPSGSSDHVTVLGHGWTTVVKAAGDPLGTGAPGSGLSASASDILNHIATPVKGGRLVTSALLTVFIADDGTVYAGPVSSDAIQQLAATGHGL